MLPPRILEVDASLAAEADLLQIIADPEATCVNRNRAAYEVVWLRRSRPSGWASNPLLASSLTLNDAVILYDKSLASVCSSSLGLVSARRCTCARMRVQSEIAESTVD